MDFEAYLDERRRLYGEMEREMRDALERDCAEQELEVIELRYRAEVEAVEGESREPRTR